MAGNSIKCKLLFSTYAHFWQYTSIEEKITYPNKLTLSILMLREMEYGLFDGGEDDEHSGIGFVEISKILATQDTFFVLTSYL